MKDFLRLFRLFAPYRYWMAAGIVLSVTVVLSNIALLVLSGWFITAMALTGLGLQTINYFVPAAAIRGLAVVRTLARYFERLVTHEATFRLLSELRVWFYERLEPLAPGGLEGDRHGDLVARLRSDIDSLDNLYLRIIAPVAAAILAGVIVIGGLSIFSPGIALTTALALTITGVFIPLLVLRLGKTTGKHIVGIRGEREAVVAETIRGLGELLVAGAVARQRDAFSTLSEKQSKAERRTAWSTAGFDALSALVGQATVCVALVIGISAGGALTGPELVMVIFWVMASFEAVSTLPGAFYAYGETAAAARRLFEIADRKPPVPRTKQGKGSLPSRHDIRFSAVTMSYRTGEKPILQDFSLTVQQGATIGIAGPNGAGKTTVLNLLQRFRLAQSGTITIGDMPIETIGDDNLRRIIAVVAQKTHLFNATIRDNLLIACPDASDDAIRAALATAGLLDEVMAFRHGLDTMVGEVGARLSGGQARRLAIARAVLRNAPILLLDEPTEGLDPENEKKVMTALLTAMAGRTTMIVSHRPLPLRHCDHVVHLRGT